MTIAKQLIKRFFQYEARLVLRKYKPKIIAISGSVGKTSTRTAIYQALSKKFFVRKNEKSFTAELGIPLTIIGCSQGSGTLVHWIENILIGLKLLVYTNQYPEYLILEVDSDKPGDLSGLAQWLTVDMLVLTAIGDIPTHIESFGTVENFLNEQKVLIDSVAREGCIIYNGDDSAVSHLVFNAEVKTISCGLSGDVAIQGSMFEVLYDTDSPTVPVGMSFNIIPKEEEITILGSLGIHNEYAYLLAYALSRELGLSSREIASRLKNYHAEPGRMNIVAGIKESIIIDDSYNASPIAMRQAFDVFSQISTGSKRKTPKSKKIAVLGDMLELGKYGSEEHRKLAHIVSGIATHVITVGIRSRTTAEELLSLGVGENNIIQTDTAYDAGKALEGLLDRGDIVLIKGSQAMRMERVVEEVMQNPQDKNKLLVRQEPEWLERE